MSQVDPSTRLSIFFKKNTAFTGLKFLINVQFSQKVVWRGGAQ